uniref:4-hydroxybenzoate polyprenyltransferase, mitochondrial n=1 Tax=Herpetomonas muscarum TaxID=5718 RepID=T1YTE4_HERMU|nr:4-hydroxybenzoate octaprenyltransferase [Herpetomonas muscarum]
MLRHTFLLQKVTRSWTKSSISAASAHFPESVRAVDPASQRDASTTAKERRVWTLNETRGTGGLKSTQPPAPVAPPKLLRKPIEKIKLYADLVRFDRPVGWQLLVIPCFWGSSLAVTKALVYEGADPLVLCAPFIPIHLFVYFIVGAYAMRSVGCIVNDMWDRKYDRLVERTAQRPLACGSVTMAEASAVLCAHLTLGGIVALSLSPAALTAALAITPVWIIYPFMKRVTHIPQLTLGLCFNWGIFVGYAAVLGRVDLAVCLPVYLGAVVWTILYDTIYAYQDREDDLKCGVKSTAIWFGDRKYFLDLMIAPVTVGLLVTGAMVAQSLPYYIGVLMCMYRLHTIIDDVNIYDRWSCARGFKRNVNLGMLIFLAMILGNAVWAYASEHEAEKDANTNTVDGIEAPLLQHLLMSNKAEPRLYDASSFNGFDRAVHPVFVQAEAAKARGETEPPAIPAWMRREYFGDNMSVILRTVGCSEEQVDSFLKWWYSMTDHYNMFSKLQL